jgi:hypothetical protein
MIVSLSLINWKPPEWTFLQGGAWRTQGRRKPSIPNPIENWSRPMPREQRQRLRDACEDGDKVFTAEIVLMLLDVLDEAEKSAQPETD